MSQSKIFDRKDRLGKLNEKWQNFNVALWFQCSEGKRTHQWHRQQVSCHPGEQVWVSSYWNGQTSGKTICQKQKKIVLVLTKSTTTSFFVVLEI